MVHDHGYRKSLDPHVFDSPAMKADSRLSGEARSAMSVQARRGHGCVRAAQLDGDDASERHGGGEDGDRRDEASDS